MVPVLIALLGIAGTLAAGVLAARSQRESAALMDRAADRRRLVDHRAEAFGAFAEHVIEYRRVEIERWHQVHDSQVAGQFMDAEAVTSAPEARAARSAAWGSFYLMRLLWDDRRLISGAEDLLHATSGLEHCHENELKVAADEVRRALGELADHARTVLTA